MNLTEAFPEWESHVAPKYKYVNWYGKTLNIDMFNFTCPSCNGHKVLTTNDGNKILICVDCNKIVAWKKAL